MTVTVYVPGVVPGFLAPPPPPLPPLPPPQATMAVTTPITNAPNVNVTVNLRADLFANIAVTASTKNNPNHSANNGALGLLGLYTGNTEDGAVVEIESAEVVEPEPGVSEDGENEQDVSEGRPEQASETGFVNAPNFEPIAIVYVAGCPG